MSEKPNHNKGFDKQGERIKEKEMKKFKLIRKKIVLSLIIGTLILGRFSNAYAGNCSCTFHYSKDDEDQSYCTICDMFENNDGTGYSSYQCQNDYSMNAYECNARCASCNNPPPSPSPDNPPAPPKPKIEYRYSKKPVLEAITTDTTQIKGKAGNNAKVTIVVNNVNLGETKATATGEFAYKLTKSLKANDEVKAKGEDPDWENYRYFVVDSDVTKVKGFELKDSSVQTDLTAKDIAAME